MLKNSGKKKEFGKVAKFEKIKENESVDGFRKCSEI